MVLSQELALKKREEFRRDASYERSHLFVPGDNVIVAFRIHGPVSRESLQAAILEAQKVHPMIGVHIEFDESRQAWFVAKGTPPCPFKVISRVDENTWLQAVLAEYWHPFKITQEPLIRFILVQGEVISEVVTFAQHSICDGLSLVYLLRDIMTSLGNPQHSLPVRDRVPTIKEAFDLTSVKLNPLIKKLFLKMNSLLKQNQIIFTEEDFSPLYDAFRDQGINAVFWALDPNTTEKLIAKCHQEGVSVNSALYCAILNVQHALQGEIPPFRKRIMMPVNLRGFIKPPIDEVVGLYAGGETFEINLKWNQDFWKQVQKVHKELLKRITPNSIFAYAKRMTLLEPALMDARIMMFLGGLSPHPTPKYQELIQIIEHDRFLAKMKAKTTSTQLQVGTTLTNLGAVRIPEKYGPYELQQVIFLPPSSPIGEKLIGVVTFRNQLQGTIAFAEKTLDPAIATRFARMIETFIQKIVMTV